MTARVDNACELCREAGGRLVWRSALCRVVRIDDPYYPGFCRVILNRHVREMSDLPAAEQQALMQVVFGVERVLRTLFCPDKINLASFGNLVPHIHWHVIPRWHDDRHFPEPVWGAVKRQGDRPAPPVTDQQLAAALTEELAEAASGA